LNYKFRTISIVERLKYRTSPCGDDTQKYLLLSYINCQLGSAIKGVKQLNYAQYNQGMRQNQNFYKTPQNSYGKMVPPGYANNQRVPQKSSLEILMESYVMNQSKQLQELKNQTRILNDSLAKLTSKVDSIATHANMLETQISHVAQHVATSSQTLRVFIGQTEVNPKAHINAIILRDGKQLEVPVVKATIIEREESDKLRSEKALEKSEKPLVSPPYKLKVPFPQRLAKPNLEAPFEKFINMLKNIHINIPFVEALSRMPLYANFLKDILLKKRTIEGNATITLTKECNNVLKKSPPKLGDPGSFSIPYVIGSETVHKAMCDLGASISLLPLSLFKRMGIGELKPTKVTLKLAALLDLLRTSPLK